MELSTLKKALFDPNKAVSLTAKAGAITMHHVRMIHGSRSNQSNRNRPILLIGYSAADAWPLRGISSIEEFDGRMICGQSQLPRLEKVPVRMPYPPTPDQGSIFENQRLSLGSPFNPFHLAILLLVALLPLSYSFIEKHSQ